MGDFFLKNSKEMSNEKLSMRKAALTAMFHMIFYCTLYVFIGLQLHLHT